MTTRFVVDAAVLGEQSLMRGDHAVRARFPDINRTLALKWLKAGRIMIDGERASLASRAVAGSVVVVDVAELRLGPARKSPFVLLFEGENLAVLDKEAGVAMHDGPGVGGDAGVYDPNDMPLTTALADLYEVEPGFAGPSFLGRLDRPTSGLVVAAFSRAALESVEPRWKSGAMRKLYLTLVHGVVESVEDITVNLAARRAHQRGKGQVEEARTLVTPLASSAGVSLVLCELFTGRTHQIRRHLKAIGHPLVGDPRYGRRQPNAIDERAGGLLLHAWMLRQRDDVEGKNTDDDFPLPPILEAPWPPKLIEVLGSIGLNVDQCRQRALAIASKPASTV